MRGIVYSLLTEAGKEVRRRAARPLPAICYEIRSYKSNISRAYRAFDVTAAARRSPLSPCDGPDFALLGKMQRLQGPASFTAGLSCANHEKSAHVLPSGI